MHRKTNKYFGNKLVSQTKNILTTKIFNFNQMHKANDSLVMGNCYAYTVLFFSYIVMVLYVNNKDRTKSNLRVAESWQYS